MIEFLNEFYEFLRVKIKYWPSSTSFVLFLFGSLIVLSQLILLNLFIYTIF
jgi:hypothetical protein